MARICPCCTDPCSACGEDGSCGCCGAACGGVYHEALREELETG